MYFNYCELISLISPTFITITKHLLWFVLVILCVVCLVCDNLHVYKDLYAFYQGHTVYEGASPPPPTPATLFDILPAAYNVR